MRPQPRHLRCGQALIGGFDPTQVWCVGYRELPPAGLWAGDRFGEKRRVPGAWTVVTLGPFPVGDVPGAFSASPAQPQAPHARSERIAARGLAHRIWK
ncbi:hypothetical protein GCM10023205_62170 [Yinghuangia aomiensis]|uniref:Uncharacterized protein n=1 Tax=Yinghuangia aomiensis TaxID=676205 RepID=A0ABP9I016_9ACTN